MSEQVKDYVPGTHPDLPPPALSVGVVGWLRANLFSNWTNTLLTLLVAYGLVTFIPPILDWLIFNAVVDAGSRTECWAVSTEGACWAIIKHRILQFTFGFYPEEHRWRPVVAFGLLFIALY
nr:amino acid ABC transporter permease [Gammaproteobacteria bacterium]